MEGFQKKNLWDVWYMVYAVNFNSKIPFWPEKLKDYSVLRSFLVINDDTLAYYE